MEEQKQIGQLPEAPVSWTVRYISSQGFDCTLTLRGFDAADLLRQAHALLQQMAKGGAKPQSLNNESPKAPAGQAPEPPPAEDPSWCPIHHVQMQRWQKGTRTWYSHQLEDGTWCRGKKGG